MQMQITDNGRSNRMLHVNHAREPHINQDSHTECRMLINHAREPHVNQDSYKECFTLTMHGSQMLIKIPTLNAAH